MEYWVFGIRINHYSNTPLLQYSNSQAKENVT